MGAKANGGSSRSPAARSTAGSSSSGQWPSLTKSRSFALPDNLHPVLRELTARCQPGVAPGLNLLLKLCSPAPLNTFHDVMWEFYVFHLAIPRFVPGSGQRQPRHRKRDPREQSNLAVLVPSKASPRRSTEASPGCGTGTKITCLGRGAPLWALGVPLPIIILLALFWHH